MTYVNIVALSYPPNAGEAVEKRFAERKKAVDGFPGFESFELLRPKKGSDRYLVVTRWRDRQAHEAWLASRAEQGADAAQRANPANAGLSVEPMEFEVVDL